MKSRTKVTKKARTPPLPPHHHHHHHTSKGGKGNTDTKQKNQQRKTEHERQTEAARHGDRLVCLLVGCLLGCLTSQQQASVSQGRICSDNFTCCHTEIEVADPTFYLTQSQYTDTGPTSPSADPITPGEWQGSHWNANF